MSNSSSCSFVLNIRPGDAIKAFCGALSRLIESGDVFDFENQIETTLDVKKKRAGDVLKAIGRDRADVYAPAGGQLNVSLDELAALSRDEKALSCVESVEFSCEDTSAPDKFYLALMYRFFERKGCAPDACGTEHEFLRPDEFAAALATA